MKTPEEWADTRWNEFSEGTSLTEWVAKIQDDAREGMVPFDMPKLMPTTAQLVLDFAKALADKLAAAEVKYGYGDSWATPDAEDWPHPKCFTDLVKHLQKGDPRDVAIYCAFLWYHGLSTSKCIEMAGMVPAAELQAVEKERDEYSTALAMICSQPSKYAKPIAEAALKVSEAEAAKFMKEYREGKHPLSKEDEAALERSKPELMRRLKALQKDEQ